MKRLLILAPFLLWVGLPNLSFTAPPDRRYDFPIYTNNPPGRQLSGAHAPAVTAPLAPMESLQKIQVPQGFEVRLFAAEPDVANPVAMTWDERGRLWVLELYEYPKGAPGGRKGRDRIKILEDTDADGDADKVSVFAEGYSLATGLALGNGGVYLAVAPNLLFLQDTNGDDKADKETVLLTGLGMEDRHELLNGLAWGPDGMLYMTHGVFTHSNVRNPDKPDAAPVKMDAAVARFHPGTREFEVFADGTSNPWGVDWNERGDAFVEACVIHHLFHMAPGAQLNRQGGTWAHPYGYVGDLPSRGLPAIVDWRHFRAAHSGICIYQGHQYPEAWRGLVLLGNIHQSAINADRLSPLGATYRAEKESRLLGPEKTHTEVGAGNFLTSLDPWFRPVSVQTGPDGVLWVMDWYDKYPCYQNAQADPEGVDREGGRIWRVVWVGDKPNKPWPTRPEIQMDLARLSVRRLVEMLNHANSWQRRQAQRLLSEQLERQRIATPKDLEQTALSGTSSLAARMAALAVLHRSRRLTSDLLDRCARVPEPAVRGWVARFTGERHEASPSDLQRLATLARDSDPSVRAATATALRQFTSGSLTVNTPPVVQVSTETLLPLFRDLLARPSVEGDFYYPHILWMAMEPKVAEDPGPFLPLFSDTASTASSYCIYRAYRRICDLPEMAREKHLNHGMQFLAEMASKTNLAGAALDGLLKSYEAKGAPPSIPLEPVFAKLTEQPALSVRARRLATLLGDANATRTLLARVNNPKAAEQERLQGIQAARDAKSDAARAELLKLIAQEKDNQTLLAEGIRALGAFGGDDIGYAITESWSHFSLPTRRVASDVLVARSKWSRALLAGVDMKSIDPNDISATARRALARSEDATVRDHAGRVLGRFRATGEERLKLIAAKRHVVLSAQPDLIAGHEVAKRTCFVCHKLHGEGADVGPDLTGVGRSSLDALLHNTIDPNEVVGLGYETTEVELKDGSVLSGRIIENTDTRLKLLATGPVEHAVAKSDIATDGGKPKIRTLESSLMPEGLELMPDEDFRNMIWFLLNPPQDNRPWTPALRKELLGDEAAGLPRSGDRALRP